jgi:hypothetical protein
MRADIAAVLCELTATPNEIRFAPLAIAESKVFLITVVTFRTSWRQLLQMLTGFRKSKLALA